MSPPVWFITAASSGFGKFTALEALSRGYTVIATSRNSSKLGDLKDKGAITADMDVTADISSLKTAVEELHKQVGRFDVLINAAGYALVGALEEATPKETFDQFNTNVFGVLNVTRVFLPYMRSQRSGAIGLFGSLGSWGGSAGAGLYCSTKWAVSALAESLRLEMKPFGVEVACIEPGYFRTGFLNPSARVLAEAQFEAYDDTPVGQTKNALEGVDNNQPGDVAKGAKVIVDVMSKAEGKEIPIRLVLGSDCRAGIKDKCDSTLSLLEEWKDVIDSTDYEKGQ